MSKVYPLTGIRVLDLTRILAGPLCTQYLGDLGAEIIKIENPKGGDDTRAWGPPFLGTESAYYLGINRNKKSICLDIKTKEGFKILKDLIKKSDFKKLDSLLKKLPKNLPLKIKKIEKVTNHDVKAVERYIKNFFKK